MSNKSTNGLAPATEAAAQADVSHFDQGEELKTKEFDPEHLAIVKSNLDLAWVKIQNALQQETEGHKLWTEGTLELINILDDARKRLGSDQAFGTWLSENGYGANRITRHDRSALLNMALDLHVTREVLAQTHRRSWRLIWEEEMQPRLPSAGQPTDGTRRPKKTKGAKKPGNEPEWLQDTRGWFGNQVDSINAVVREVTAVMEKCKDDEQHKKLRMTAESELLLDAVRNLAEKCAKFDEWLGLEDAANTLIKEGRAKTTPARRASAPIRPSV